MNTYTIGIEHSDGSLGRLYTTNNKTEAQAYFITANRFFSTLDVVMDIKPIKA